MASSPLTLADGLVNFEIEIEGSPLDPAIEVRAIKVAMTPAESRAWIQVFDGSPSDANFPLSDGNDFVPGNAIRIALGYDGKLTTVFSGSIVRQTLEILDNMGPRRRAHATADLPTGTIPTGPVLTLTYGESILKFEGSFDARGGAPRGEVTFQGSALAVLGAAITLAGLGARFNGDVPVTKVSHWIADGQWLTTVRFGCADCAEVGPAGFDC